MYGGHTEGKIVGAENSVAVTRPRRSLAGRVKFLPDQESADDSDTPVAAGPQETQPVERGKAIISPPSMSGPRATEGPGSNLSAFKSLKPSTQGDEASGQAKCHLSSPPPPCRTTTTEPIKDAPHIHTSHTQASDRSGLFVR